MTVVTEVFLVVMEIDDNIKIGLWIIWCGLDSSLSGKGQLVGFCEDGNELSSVVECGWFLDYLSIRNFLLHRTI